MAKIIDPDDLTRASAKDKLWTDGNIWIDTPTLKISMAEYDKLSSDWVTLQCVYSYLKEEWKSDDNLIKFNFPIVSITNEQFELVNNWDFEDDTTKNLIRDGWYALKDSNGTSLEEYANITTLWSFDDPTTDKAYYLQSAGWTPIDVVLTWPVNQAVRMYVSISWTDISFANSNSEIKSTSTDLSVLKVWDIITISGSSDNDWTFTVTTINNSNSIYVAEAITDEDAWNNISIVANYKTFFQIFLREQGKKYDNYDLIVQQNISSLTYKKYALPLSNSVDLKITHTDDDIDNNDPYTWMSITYYASAQTRTIGWTDYNFSIIIDWNNWTAEEIYEFAQRQLRKAGDIDADTDNVLRWDIAEWLLKFVWDTLKTKLTSKGWVYIDNFQSNDINRLVFVDDTWVERTYPYVAAGKIYFNENLQNDTSAKYRMFFTNDDAWDNSWRDFGTDDAIIVQDTNWDNITWDVNSQVYVYFTYNYDSNTQRWDASAWTDAPITLVATWLDKAQYIKATWTIIKSTTNNFSMISNLERNYVS